MVEQCVLYCIAYTIFKDFVQTQLCVLMNNNDHSYYYCHIIISYTKSAMYVVLRCILKPLIYHNCHYQLSVCTAVKTNHFTKSLICHFRTNAT